jgi:hypothetical protein
VANRLFFYAIHHPITEVIRAQLGHGRMNLEVCLFLRRAIDVRAEKRLLAFG